MFCYFIWDKCCLLCSVIVDTTTRVFIFIIYSILLVYKFFICFRSPFYSAFVSLRWLIFISVLISFVISKQNDTMAPSTYASKVNAIHLIQSDLISYCNQQTIPEPIQLTSVNSWLHATAEWVKLHRNKDTNMEDELIVIYFIRRQQSQTNFKIIAWHFVDNCRL